MLFESVGNGHNDVMVALFLVLALAATLQTRWLLAVFFVIAGSMVKLYTLVFLPPLVLAWMRRLSGWRARIGAALAAGTVGIASALLLYAPVWSGTALFRNITRNPAATEYESSVWQLLGSFFAPTNDQARFDAVADNLDTIRHLHFAAAFLVLMLWLWKGHRLSDTWVWLWLAYCLSLSWVWPWYLMLAVPVAALCGPVRAAAVAVGFTMGGLLFWVGWPARSVPDAFWLYRYRSLLLFAPGLLIAVWPVLGRLVDQALGVREIQRAGGSAERISIAGEQLESDQRGP